MSDLISAFGPKGAFTCLTSNVGYWPADIDYWCAVRHSGLMEAEKDIAWVGLGRWLMICLGILLVLVAVPLVFSRENGAAAGWNIFLGLLAIGTVASGNHKAPLLAVVLTVLMAIRLVAALIFGARGIDLAASLIFLVIAGGAAYELRRQSTST